MKRPFILPVTAAVIGSLLAVGVWAGTRKAKHWAQEQHFYAVEVADQLQAQLDGAGAGQVIVGPEDIQVDGESLRQAMEDVRVQIRAAVESDRDLTEAEKARIREALERFEAKLPFRLDLDARIEINGEKLEIRSSAEADQNDVLFELDIKAPEAPATGAPSGN